MIYPILRLNQEETTIEYIDTTLDDNPFLEVAFGESQEDAVMAWLNILAAFVNQYWYGYELGYDDALGDIDEDEQGDTEWI